MNSNPKNNPPDARTRSGAQCVIDGLERAGCEILFGLPGGAVLDIFDRLRESSLHFVLSRHEQGAVHMADGYARARGKTGCCIVTSGPGATNAITGLATAFMDGIPLVCITGQVPLNMIGNDAFQEADTTGITRAVTKHNYLVRSVDDLPRILAEAFYIAATGKPGPVLIDIPKDIQQARTAVADPETIAIRGCKPTPPPNPAEIARLAEAIRRARRPVFYVGGGVIAGNASEALTALARKARIPVTTTLLGLGAFPETDPLSLRMLGMHGSYAANNAVSHCDLLVAIGARFDDRVTGKISEFAPKAKIAHIDIDPSTIGKSIRTDLAVVGHVRDVLEALSEHIEPGGGADPAWLEQTMEWRRKHPFAYPRNPGSLPAQQVIEQIYEISRGEAIVVTDVGQHQMWAAHYYKYTRPRTFLSSGGLGTMGYGLPAAIGAQFAFPDRNVVCISGDGSIQMNFQELVVAVEHKLPVNIVVLNNQHLGMVRQWQEMFYKTRYSGVQLGQADRPANEKIDLPGNPYLPDMIRLAEAHGARARRVHTGEEAEAALREAFDSPEPWLIECMTDPFGNVYPMVPPGASLNEMIHSMA